ncbi:uncharacterized protein A1O9_00540 [Exophiala aquamarina CBS 119918]|uniref:PNPLA domain-containing protein n=1 Tax=Exophiala aquamarina CBS 119918 TaxID=1182545 RepID=A0A072PS17_9EURO|nr:uncharacterized protein A1O9_00540 [Exophiala aquamarina CBS 119918]KEF62567.1 hypothetical protein A1O9_00540 [Exophiala aquamarina CBS 119918]
MEDQRPLRILTLDGGGLQALATLTVLKETCKAIAKQNGAVRPPAPHELFDIIGGVGTGGWIALLLGRYRLDIATCMAVYMEIARDVEMATNATSFSSQRKRLFKLDQDGLTTVVQGVLERYDLDPSLLGSNNEQETDIQHTSSRCKYAFAVGVVQRTNNQKMGFQLFRSYTLHGSGQAGLRAGPAHERWKLPEVFAATGAAKFFLDPYKVGNTVFFDDTFPQSHPITLIGLDEAFAIYGKDVPISVLLNIGPGIPSERDRLELEEMSTSSMTRLARKFSWPPKGRHLSRIGRLLSNTSDGQGTTPPARDEESTHSRSSLTVLKLEGQRRDDIKQRLKELYGESGPDRYHHLGPEYSDDKASLNDVHALCRAWRSNSNRQPELNELRLAIQAEAESMVEQHWVGAAAA